MQVGLCLREQACPCASASKLAGHRERKPASQRGPACNGDEAPAVFNRHGRLLPVALHGGERLQGVKPRRQANVSDCPTGRRAGDSRADGQAIRRVGWQHRQLLACMHAGRPEKQAVARELALLKLSSTALVPRLMPRVMDSSWSGSSTRASTASLAAVPGRFSCSTNRSRAAENNHPRAHTDRHRSAVSAWASRLGARLVLRTQQAGKKAEQAAPGCSSGAHLAPVPPAA